MGRKKYQAVGILEICMQNPPGQDSLGAHMSDAFKGSEQKTLGNSSSFYCTLWKSWKDGKIKISRREELLEDKNAAESAYGLGHSGIRIKIS